jgi:hypothetical protein
MEQVGAIARELTQAPLVLPSSMATSETGGGYCARAASDQTAAQPRRVMPTSRERMAEYRIGKDQSAGITSITRILQHELLADVGVGSFSTETPDAATPSMSAVLQLRRNFAHCSEWRSVPIRDVSRCSNMHEQNCGCSITSCRCGCSNFPAST